MGGVGYVDFVSFIFSFQDKLYIFIRAVFLNIPRSRLWPGANFVFSRLAVTFDLPLARQNSGTELNPPSRSKQPVTPV